jgi:tRNA threonylcarbamoyladenosine biosynthesis protein TsaB
MLILTIRTDKPEAELGLFEGNKELTYETWLAHRELAETIHTKIDAVLKSQGKELKNLQGLVVFKGPGSFTGLRIGITVANALADAYKLPLTSTAGEKWAIAGIEKLLNGIDEKIVVPEYGSEPHITLPKH